MAKQTGYPSIDKPWLKYYSEEAIVYYGSHCIYNSRTDYGYGRTSKAFIPMVSR
ncbi:MAG: hypothetical protein ACI4FZ_12170 [Lachnospiraceae bacterium]